MLLTIRSGLGIGTSQTGMLRHGVETDIVELDPAVYKYATDYFGLLPNHTAYIEDAVGFVATRAKQESPQLYDYVIHDVFTGGAAPAALFTKEMVEDMKKIMADDGVIAIVSFTFFIIICGNVQGGGGMMNTIRYNPAHSECPLLRVMMGTRYIYPDHTIFLLHISSCNRQYT